MILFSFFFLIAHLSCLALATTPCFAEIHGTYSQVDDSFIEIAHGRDSFKLALIPKRGICIRQGRNTFGPALTLIYRFDGRWIHANAFIRNIIKDKRVDAVIMTLHTEKGYFDPLGEIGLNGDIQRRMLAEHGHDPNYVINWFAERGDQALIVYLNWK